MTLKLAPNSYRYVKQFVLLLSALLCVSYVFFAIYISAYTDFGEKLLNSNSNSTNDSLERYLERYLILIRIELFIANLTFCIFGLYVTFKSLKTGLFIYGVFLMVFSILQLYPSTENLILLVPISLQFLTSIAAFFFWRTLNKTVYVEENEIESIDSESNSGFYLEKHSQIYCIAQSYA